MKFSKSFLGGVATLLLLHTFAGSGLAAPRPPQPPWPQETLKIFGFDSAYANVPWRNLAVNEEEAAGTESWSGYALNREGFITAPVVIPLRVSEQELNLAPASGAVRFWFAPNWSTASKTSRGKGPGHAARLLELVNLNGKKAHTRWSLFLNGEPGKRVIAYLDDVRIEGQVPEEKAYLAQAQQAFTASTRRAAPAGAARSAAARPADDAGPDHC